MRPDNKLHTLCMCKQAAWVQTTHAHPLPSIPQNLVRQYERRTSECPLMERLLLMAKTDARMGQKTFQSLLVSHSSTARPAMASVVCMWVR